MGCCSVLDIGLQRLAPPALPPGRKVRPGRQRIRSPLPAVFRHFARPERLVVRQSKPRRQRNSHLDLRSIAACCPDLQRLSADGSTKLLRSSSAELRKIVLF